MSHIHSNTPTTLLLHDLNDTDRLGRILAQLLPAATTVALNGTLGAGKTRLVQAVAIACGVDIAEIGSPTFVLCREYHSKTHSIYHADVYRLTHPHEFWELGAEEWFQSSAITFLEWAERVQAFLPEEYLELTLEVVGESERLVTLMPHGAKYCDLVSQIEAHYHSQARN